MLRLLRVWKLLFGQFDLSCVQREMASGPAGPACVNMFWQCHRHDTDHQAMSLQTFTDLVNLVISCYIMLYQLYHVIIVISPHACEWLLTETTRRMVRTGPGRKSRVDNGKRPEQVSAIMIHIDSWSEKDEKECHAKSCNTLICRWGMIPSWQQIQR